MIGLTVRRHSLLLIALLAVAAVALPAQGTGQFAFPLQASSVRFAAIGDMGSAKQPQFDVANQMVKSRAVFPFEFVITLGDNIYTGNKPKDYQKAFAAPYKSLLDAGVLFYAALGNHDDTNQRFYKPFNMGGDTYYAYTKRNVRFFVLDSTYMDPKQLTWLEGQLRGAGKDDWKVCYFHHPLYSSAKAHGPADELRDVLEPLFVKYGVDVVFAGHEHVYERVKPQKGIYYFTEGASGQLRPGNLRSSSPNVAKGFDTDRSFMMIEIAGNDLYFQAVSRTGVTVDSGVIPRTSR
jgi:predicted phosphodiesterase